MRATLMNRMLRILVGISALIIALAVLQGGSAAQLAAGVAAVAIAAAVAGRYLARVILRNETVVRVGARAKKQGQRAVPAPQHPHTPGRRRSRAPSQSVAAALQPLQ